MTLIEDLGKVEDNAVQKITIEVICHKNISGNQVTDVVSNLKKRLGDEKLECEISNVEDRVHLLMKTGQ
jgi:F0F1-type ATP synthase delta subunit